MKLSRVALFLTSICTAAALNAAEADYVYEAGHPSLQEWLLPATPPEPEGNPSTPAKEKLGKALFFDPRLSHDGNMSCATCHNPSLGWGDGLDVAIGFRSSELARASPTVINTAYNSIQMWDGREASLESQAMGPMENNHEMNMEMSTLFTFLKGTEGYANMFAEAFPGEEISPDTVSKAIAAFERTAVSTNSDFDRWVKGDASAMTAQQVNGFKLFNGKANCAVCHAAPNFTDNGFHNLGLPSWGDENPDMGRYAIKPIGLMKGAFKTPTIREITRTPPYFHDGSSQTLEDVMDHYNQGGVVKTNLSPNMKELNLGDDEKADIIAFMKALESPFMSVELPELPQ